MDVTKPDIAEKFKSSIIDENNTCPYIVIPLFPKEVLVTPDNSPNS
jgi:hypothetical protein